MDMGPPPAMANWLSSLPGKYVGTLYAKVRPPYSPFGFWYKVPVWGQVADGQPHELAVENMLYNSFPFHGKGWTYVEWKNEPDNPNENDAPRRGVIENPKPYNGQ